MNPKLIKVRIERFQLGKPFAREVFLNMPINGKMIRVILIGDEMSPTLLSRLRQRNVDSLFVSPREGDTLDSETFPLYLEAQSKNDEDVQAAFKTDPEPKLDKQRIAGSLGPNEETVKVKQGKEDGDVEKRISPLTKAFEESTKISASFDSQDELIRLSGDANVEEVRIVKPFTTADKDVKSFSSLRASLDETMRIISSAIKESPSEEVRTLRAELDRFVQTLDASATSEEQNAKLIAGNPLGEIIQRFESSLDVHESIVSVRLLKTLHEAAEIFATSRSPGKSLPESVAAGASILENEPAEISDSAVLASVGETLAKNGSAKKNKSYPSSTNTRAAVHNELPIMAGRLSIYLAHSLGYANTDFLSDLALGVILYFSKLEGKIVVSEDLPQLTRSIVKMQDSPLDSAIEDAIEIVSFLDAYFKNPECDRSRRDFSHRIFHEALSELKMSPKGLNMWNEVRWTQFIVHGPSMRAYSLCSKAAAAAIKDSRNMDL